jgi:hypothetical protein
VANTGLISRGARLRTPGMKFLGRERIAPNTVHGLVCEDGELTTLDISGSTLTGALGINDRGQIGVAVAGTTDGTSCPPQGGNS